MKNYLTLTLLTLALCFLTACGGGGGGDSESNDEMTTDAGDDMNNDAEDNSADDSGDDTANDSGDDSNNGSGDSGNDNSAGSVAGIAPNPAFNSSASVTIPAFANNPSVTISSASGYEGDIIARSVATTSGAAQATPFQEFELANGISSLNITNVQRVNAIESICTNNEDGGTGVVTTNYVTGVQEISGTSQNGQALSCSYTYNSILPTTISSSDSISNLLTGYADFDGEVSTTCPEDEVFTDVSEEDTFGSCEAKLLYNFVITDDTGKTHKVSLQLELMD